MKTTRIRNVLVLLAAILALAACSVSRVAYLNAPPLALWYLGGFVDMTDAQKAFVRDRLSNAIDWHRSQELPEYRKSIERLIVKADSRVSVDEARATYRQARDYYDRSIEHLLPDAAEFIAMIDDSQLARLEKKFAEDNRKILRDSVKGTPEERRERRAKKYVDQFEEWTGRLSREQREIVTAGVMALPDLTEERVADRRYRQGEIVRLIRSNAPREQIVKDLRMLLIDTESWRRPEYVKKLRDRDERIFHIVSDLTATLTPEQRANVQKKMRGYVRDISSIIASR